MSRQRNATAVLALLLASGALFAIAALFLGYMGTDQNGAKISASG
jgi:hypothetical protein